MRVQHRVCVLHAEDTEGVGRAVVDSDQKQAANVGGVQQEIVPHQGGKRTKADHGTRVLQHVPGGLKSFW